MDDPGDPEDPSLKWHRPVTRNWETDRDRRYSTQTVSPQAPLVCGRWKGNSSLGPSTAGGALNGDIWSDEDVTIKRTCLPCPSGRWSEGDVAGHVLARWVAVGSPIQLTLESADKQYRWHSSTGAVGTSKV